MTSPRATTTTTTPRQLNFYKLSFEGTRRWRALKLWMSWKHLGTAGFGHLIELTDDLAAYLARRCAEADDFEAVPGGSRPQRRLLPAPARGPRRRARAARRVSSMRHQDALQRALEVSGDGWLTTTRLRDSTWLRAGIVNYLSTEDDIDRLIETLRRLAAELGRPARTELSGLTRHAPSGRPERPVRPASLRPLDDRRRDRIASGGGFVEIDTPAGTVVRRGGTRRGGRAFLGTPRAARPRRPGPPGSRSCGTQGRDGRSRHGRSARRRPVRARPSARRTTRRTRRACAPASRRRSLTRGHGRSRSGVPR